MRNLLVLGSGALAIAAFLSGCGDDAPAATPTAAPATQAATKRPEASPTAKPSPAATMAAATTAPASPAATSAASPTAGKVSANKATRAQIQAALEAAGVPNAAQWAKEVEEYRPYAADVNFPKLRQELAKYNPGAGVVDKIIAVLEP